MQCRLLVGGRNKYLINGKLAQPSQFQNLLHSVQLNVNNPHFLIMQGRITKVLNMKPPAILSMLEEVAGTRMCETKKEAALKILEKKQSKVRLMRSTSFLIRRYFQLWRIYGKKGRSTCNGLIVTLS